MMEIISSLLIVYDVFIFDRSGIRTYVQKVEVRINVGVLFIRASQISFVGGCQTITMWQYSLLEQVEIHLLVDAKL